MMHEYKIRPPLGLYIVSSLALVILILGMVSATASMLRYGPADLSAEARPQPANAAHREKSCWRV